MGGRHFADTHCKHSRSSIRMNQEKPNWLYSAFSQPVATFKLTNMDNLNSELIKIIMASESKDLANLTPSQKIQPEVFESKFDFLNWKNPNIQTLKDIFLDRLKEVICSVNGNTQDSLLKLAIGHDSWFHITRRGGYVQPHDHPNASWSAVYCVATGTKDENHQDSGSLILLNPAGAINMYKDPCNSAFKKEFSQNSLKYILESGDLLIFPSYLQHWVSPFIGNGERITIASNWWFWNK